MNERNCPGLWPWSCSVCPDYLKKSCDDHKKAQVTEHPPERVPSLMEIAAINAALRKLYPDDFALKINERQLAQQQAEHDATPERLCDECDIIEVEERLINAEQDLKDAKEQAKREERERVLKLLEPVETEFEKHFRYAEGKEYEIWGTALNRVRTVMDTLRKINREGDSPP